MKLTAPQAITSEPQVPPWAGIRGFAVIRASNEVAPRPREKFSIVLSLPVGTKLREWAGPAAANSALLHHALPTASCRLPRSSDAAARARTDRHADPIMDTTCNSRVFGSHPLGLESLRLRRSSPSGSPWVLSNSLLRDGHHAARGRHPPAGRGNHRPGSLA